MKRGTALNHATYRRTIMQRKSFVTAAALAGGLALGLVFGPAITDSASAQTVSPSASATASASAAEDDTTLAPDDCPARGGGRESAPSESVTPQASPATSTSSDV